MFQLFEDIVDLLDPQFNINEIQDDDFEGLGKLDEHLEEGSFPEADQNVRTKPDDLG